MLELRQQSLSPAGSLEGRLLTKNSLWNLVGWGAPLLVAVVAIPLLIKGLGTERFGILTLMWVGIGYCSLFDIGLGQALTKLVAEKLGLGRSEEIPSLVWTALALMAVLGAVGTVVAGLLTPWLVHAALKISSSLQFEVLLSFYLLALSIPMVISAAGLCGVLEAYQRFDVVNAVRIPLGLFNFLSPLIVLLFSRSLVGIIAVLIVGRVAAWLSYLWLCLRVIPSLRNVAGDRAALRPLLFFGGWTTVTNIVGPLMVYLDRFLIGTLVSMTAVGFYAAPYEVVMRLTIIPVALVGVLFPALSSGFMHDRQRAIMLFDRGLNYIFLILFPVTLMIVTLAKEGLEIWLGHDFAHNSAGVLQWLAIGVFINSLARVPFAVIQAKGRPDVTAKLHIVELPIYLMGLWWLLNMYGILGAAIAWVLRVSFDTLILFAMAYRFVPDTGPSIHRSGTTLSAALPVILLFSIPADILHKAMLLALTLAIFIPIAWFFILEPPERHFFRAKLRIPSLLSG
jgi:O-antigen/teichoic acid export membrane protein